MRARRAVIHLVLVMLLAGGSTAATVSGSLDKDVVRRVIKRNLTKITRCYEKQLQAKPNIGGHVLVTFTIEPDGGVHDVTAKGFDSDVDRCIEESFRTFQFPPTPPGKGKVIVNYPFDFKPA